jgi:predicted MFS family arabinose efflux permease
MITKSKYIKDHEFLYKDKNLLTILIATTLRGYNLGFMGVFLGVYFYFIGLSDLKFGIALSCVTFSGALSNLFVYFFKNIISRKQFLIIMSVSSVIGGFIFLITENYFLILLASLLSISSITGGDRTGITSVEIPIISKLVELKKQTIAYSVYNFLPMISKIIGTSILLIVPILTSVTELKTKTVYSILLIIYIVISIVQTIVYNFLDHKIEAKEKIQNKISKIENNESTLIIIITFLFAIDSFGGGFIARSFITFWLIKKFSLSEATLSIIFIIAQVLNGLSLVIAPKIAKSIGVLNTMILSQMIANGIIIVAALSSNWILATVLYLIKESFNDLDIPTRQAFMMSIVKENNQTQMASMSNLGRTAAHTFSPGIAGYISSVLGISLSLVFGSTIKLLYSLILLRFKFSTFNKLEN